MFSLHHPHHHTLIRNFAIYLNRLGYSKGSQQMLPACVREFLYRQEEQQRSDITMITSTDIMDHHAYLQHRPNLRRSGALSERMIYHHVYAVRLFF